MIAAVAIGDRIAAVLEHHAHAGDSGRGLGIGGAAAVGDPAPDRHPAGDLVAPDAHDGVGDIAGQPIVADRLHPVDRIARRGARLHLGGVADRPDGARGERRQGHGEARPVRGDLGGGRLIIDSNRFGSKSHCRRKQIGDPDDAGRKLGVRIADLDGEDHRLARRRDVARRLLDEVDRRPGPVDRNADPHRLRPGQREGPAIGRVDDGERPPLRRAKARHLGGRPDRRDGIALRGLDPEAVDARPDQRESVEAGREIVDRAAAVGDGAAADHAARIGRGTVVAEDLGGLAGGLVDQGDPRSGEDLAVEAVENEAERVGEHFEGRRRRDGAMVGAEALDGEMVARLDAEPAIVAGRGGWDLRGLDEAGELAGIGRGFEDGQRLAVAAAGANDDFDRFHGGGVVVAVGVVDHEEERLAGEDLAHAQERGRIESLIAPRSGERSLGASGAADRRRDRDRHRRRVGGEAVDGERKRVGRRDDVDVDPVRLLAELAAGRLPLDRRDVRDGAMPRRARGARGRGEGEPERRQQGEQDRPRKWSDSSHREGGEGAPCRGHVAAPPLVPPSSRSRGRRACGSRRQPCR